MTNSTQANEPAHPPGAGQELLRPGAGVPLPEAMIRVEGVTLRYDERIALDDLSLEVAPGELFALLGPNGSGKSTFLRVLSTLIRPSQGRAVLDGLDLFANPAAVRRHLGVVFQGHGLDGKLTVQENLRFQGYLYGLSGRELSRRIAALLERFGLAGRAKERAEALSGGLQRRVELAKALLHRPAVLLLDEPSSGLDLGARQTFWQALTELRAENGLTVVVATHLMDEAEPCGRVALLDEGRLIALDPPAALKRELGETVITLETADPPLLARKLAERMGLQAVPGERGVRIAGGAEPELTPRLMSEFGEEIGALRLGRPTLEDVFLARTGHSIGGKGADGGGEAS